ncbi:hypothetical protein ACH5RR_008630, partial [Cinchona calisaya]
MAGPMKEKFEKYWDECCLVLAIAVVFDPRFKWALVEYNYNAIYGENAKKYVDGVRSAIVDLFVEYGGELNPSFGYACGSDVEESNFTGANKESDDISDDMFSNFDKWYYRSKSSTIHDYQKSELQNAAVAGTADGHHARKGGDEKIKMHTHSYCCLDYAQKYDVVRYWLHCIRKKLKDELDNKNTVQEYICQNCGKRYTALDAPQLVSMVDEYFHCEVCSGELVSENEKLTAQDTGDRDDNARRRQRDKLEDMLKKLE